MRGGVCGIKVHDQLAVLQHDGVVIVDRGHAVAVHASRYGRLVDKCDFCGPKHLERVKRLDNSGAFSFVGDPRFIFLGIHAAPLDVRRPMSTMSRLAIVYPVQLACATPVNRRRARVSNPLVGCQLAAMRSLFALQSLAIVLP
jgi:hypothetical protein